MAKRRRRKRGRRGLLLIVAIALLIAGFMARRLMMPGAARYLAPRATEYPAPAPQADAPQADASDRENAPAAHPNGNGSGEHLSDSDRRTLDEVIRRKTGGR